MPEGSGFHPLSSPCDVAVLIVTYNSEADIVELIADLRHEASDLRLRVIVVDNDSSDRTVHVVREHGDDIILLTNPGSNLGFAGGINCAQGSVAGSTFVLVLNPDLRIAPGSLRELVETASHSETGAAVPLMLDENGDVYSSLRREPSLARAFGDALLGSRLSSRPGWSSEIVPVGPLYESEHTIEWATGAALLVRSTVAEHVGPWDERFFLYSEEVDYCRRIRTQGWSIGFNPRARVIHQQGGSGSSPELEALQIVNRVRYVEKWHSSAYSGVFRLLTILGTLLRITKPGRALTLRALTRRRYWADLPRATTSTP